MWEANSGTERFRFAGSDWGAFSPDGRLLAAGAGQDAVILDAVDGRLLKRLSGHGGPVKSGAFNRDGTQLLTGGEAGRVLRWAIPEGQRVEPTHTIRGTINALRLTPDGELLLAGLPASLVVMEARSGKRVGDWPLGPGTATAVALSRDGRHFARSLYDSTVAVTALPGGED